MRTGSAGQTGRPPETATVTFKFHIPLEPLENVGREAYLNCKSKAQKYLAKQTDGEGDAKRKERVRGIKRGRMGKR